MPGGSNVAVRTQSRVRHRRGPAHMRSKLRLDGRIEGPVECERSTNTFRGRAVQVTTQVGRVTAQQVLRLPVDVGVAAQSESSRVERRQNKPALFNELMQRRSNRYCRGVRSKERDQ
eukprot:6179180-Pleurochrysis_carterae.AAC.1